MLWLVMCVCVYCSRSCQEVLSSLGPLARFGSVVTGFPQRQTSSVTQGQPSDIKTIPQWEKERVSIEGGTGGGKWWMFEASGEWERKRADGSWVVVRDFKSQGYRAETIGQKGTESCRWRKSPYKRFPVSLSFPTSDGFSLWPAWHQLNLVWD